MPLLGFTKANAPKIEDGSKVTTIRAPRKDGRDPKRGDLLYLYVGLRTKSCRRLMVARCTSVRRIELQRWVGPFLAITVDDRWLGYYYDPEREQRRIVRDEGFESVDDLFAAIERFHGLPFEGFLIRWKPL